MSLEGTDRDASRERLPPDERHAVLREEQSLVACLLVAEDQVVSSRLQLRTHAPALRPQRQVGAQDAHVRPLQHALHVYGGDQGAADDTLRREEGRLHGWKVRGGGGEWRRG